MLDESNWDVITESFHDHQRNSFWTGYVHYENDQISFPIIISKGPDKKANSRCVPLISCAVPWLYPNHTQITIYYIQMFLLAAITKSRT